MTIQLDKVLKARVVNEVRVRFPRIECVDGFSLSVQTGNGMYCEPRPEFPEDGELIGPFVSAEIGFPNARPEPWDVWEEYCEQPDSPTRTVYGYVPAEIIRALIELHGGEKGDGE